MKKNKLEKLPFNGLCQSKGCEGQFQPFENYEYQEYEPTGEQPWLAKFKQKHTITAHQCTTCGRIHGEVTQSTGEVIQFFEGLINSKPVDYQTPSEFGASKQVNTWTKPTKTKEKTPIHIN